MSRSRLRAASAAALALSGPVVGLIVATGGSLWLAFALHAAAAAGAHAFWRREGKLLALLAFTLLLAFPAVGSLIVWVVLGRGGRHQVELAADYRRYVGIDDYEAPGIRPLADPEAALRQEVAVLPLGDQLGLAAIAGKQAAASTLARMEGEAGVKILRQALTHPADDTRLLASLALLRKEEGLVASLTNARQAAKADPGDPAARLALASAARRYAESGLPAQKVARGLWAEVRREAEAAGPVLAAWLHLAAAAAALGEHAAALAAAEAALASDPACVEAGFRRLEALFMLGRREALPEAAGSLLAFAPPGTDAHEAARYWSAHAG